MISYKFITIYLPFPAISNVSDCIFCAMDSYIRHFPMGHTCVCFHMVKYFSHSINYLLLHFQCYSCFVVVINVFFYPYIDAYLLFITFIPLLFFFYRWPYPFLDLSSSYAPLWYAVIIYLIVIYNGILQLQLLLLFLNLLILPESIAFNSQR